MQNNNKKYYSGLVLLSALLYSACVPPEDVETSISQKDKQIHRPSSDNKMNTLLEQTPQQPNHSNGSLSREANKTPLDPSCVVLTDCPNSEPDHANLQAQRFEHEVLEENKAQQNIQTH